MDLSRLTIKAQAALRAAGEQAAARDHQSIEPQHLLLALLSDADGIVHPLLHQAGAEPGALRANVEESLERLPKIFAQGQEVELDAEGDGLVLRVLAST